MGTRHTTYFMDKEYPNVAGGGAGGGVSSPHEIIRQTNVNIYDGAQITLSLENKYVTPYVVALNSLPLSSWGGMVYLQNSEQIVYDSANDTVSFYVYTNTGQNYNIDWLVFEKNVAGGGGNEIEYFDFAQFDGNGSILLPFKVNSDYKITVTFQAPSYKNDNSIIGNTANSYLSHLTIYSSQYYTSTGNGEDSFSADLYTKHTFVQNDGGYSKMDGVSVKGYTPTTDNNVSLVLAGRQSSAQNYVGKIYEYIIESISTGEVIMHLLPAKAKSGGVVIGKGLYDSVSEELYTCSGLTLGNDT